MPVPENSISTELLQMIEELSGLFYTPKQIAVMIDVPIADFMVQMAIEDSPIFKAYWKGNYEADIEYRREVKRLAKLGSSPAQTLLATIINQSKMDRLER